MKVLSVNRYENKPIGIKDNDFQIQWIRKKKRKWYFEDQRIDVVSAYKYMGLIVHGINSSKNSKNLN